MSLDNDDLIYLSANEAIDRFKSGTMSPVEFMEAIINRADQIDTTVNPFADKYFDEAMESAKIAEARYRHGSARALEGIPLLVKDDAAIQGKRNTVGSLINAESIADYSTTVMNRLIHAGANIFARSTCPEFCWLFTCHSRLWGVTRNPWRLDITPGGSSGGSAAALAAGATTIATGSDSTGSIRQPAAQCGVVGYKPPYGRNPADVYSSFDPYSAVGPMTRTIADAILMQNIMSGPDLQDHNSLPEKLLIPDQNGDVKGLKIAYSVDLGFYEVTDDVKNETLATLDTLGKSGANIEEVKIDWASDAIRLANLSQEFIFAGDLAHALDQYPELVSDYVPQLAETAFAVTANDYRDGLRIAAEVWQMRLAPLFEQYDALITPAVASPEVPAENWQKDVVTINGKARTDTDTAMTVLFNMFNRCPVLSVPAGMTSAGLPVGIQIVGRPCDDVTTFLIGQAIELHRPWIQRKPSILSIPQEE